MFVFFPAKVLFFPVMCVLAVPGYWHGSFMKNNVKSLVFMPDAGFFSIYARSIQNNQ